MYIFPYLHKAMYNLKDIIHIVLCKPMFDFKKNNSTDNNSYNFNTFAVFPQNFIDCIQFGTICIVEKCKNCNSVNFKQYEDICKYFTNSYPQFCSLCAQAVFPVEK